MNKIITVLLATSIGLVATLGSATTVVGINSNSKGKLLSRGFSTSTSCKAVLDYLNVRNKPAFKIVHGKSVPNYKDSWQLSYQWDDGKWVWMCHGDVG